MTPDQQLTELQQAQLQKQNAEQALRYVLQDVRMAEQELTRLKSPRSALETLRQILGHYGITDEARRLIGVGRAVSEGRAA